MWHIPQTARIGSDKSCVWVNVVSKAVSPIFFLRSTLVTLEVEKIFLHFPTELKIHHFSYSAHDAFNIVDLSSMQKWLSSSWSLCGSIAEHHAGREGLSLDSLWLRIFFCPIVLTESKKKKTFFMCLSKINKQHKISTDRDWIFCGRGTQVSKEFGTLHF